MTLHRNLAIIAVTLLAVLAGCSTDGSTTVSTDQTVDLQRTTIAESTVEQSTTRATPPTAEALPTTTQSRLDAQPTVENVAVTLRQGESQRVSLTAQEVGSLSWQLTVSEAQIPSTERASSGSSLDMAVTLENATVSGTPIVMLSFPPQYLWEKRQATVTYEPVVTVGQNASVGTHRIPVVASTATSIEDDGAASATGYVVVDVVENRTATE